MTIVLGCSRSQVFSELIKTCKLFHMNDIEIAMWSTILEANIASWDEFDFPIAPLITGLRAKVITLRL